MKFVAARDDLIRRINIAMRAVPVRTTMPILEYILVQASERGIIFTTNDMELGVETHVEGRVEEPGTVAIHARTFSDIVRKLPDEDVFISVDDNYAITLRCGKSCFTLMGMDGADFTYLPQVEREDSISMSQFTLRQVIQQTIFSIAANENNPLMTGELFEINENGLRVASLDGHRISMRYVQLAGDYSPRRVVVPGKALQEISRILSGEVDDIVTIFFAANHIIFEIEGTMVVSRLIGGDYFDVDKMISRNYETKISISRLALMESLDRAMLFIREGDKKPIIFDFRERVMNISIDSQIGSMNEDVDIEKDGKDIMISFNAKFLMDALKAIDDETVHLYLMNPKYPGFLQDDKGTYTYLIMPVNFIA